MTKAMYYRTIISLALTVFSLSACTKGESPSGGRGAITITLNTCGLYPTRATMPGEDPYHENTIDDAVCFLYPSGSSESTQSHCYFYVHGNGAVDPTSANYKYYVEFDSGNTSFTFSPSQLQTDDEIFLRGATSCDIFVITNFRGYPSASGATTLGPDMNGNPIGDTSRAALKALQNTADFSDNAAIANHRFVMTSNVGTVSIDRSSYPYTGSCSVDLSRLAAKVQLEVNIPGNKITVANEDWIPDYNGIQWGLMGINNKAALGGDIDRSVKDIKDFDPRRFAPAIVSQVTEDGVEKSLATFAPGYSYPWPCLGAFPNDLSSEEDPRGVYIKIMVPVSNGSRTQYFHYKTRLITGSLLSDNVLQSNHWYKQRVNISVAGTISETNDPVEIDGMLSIMPWQTVSTGVVIYDRRYLDILYGDIDVDRATDEFNTEFGTTGTQNVIILDNQNSVSVPIETSHRAFVKSVSIKAYDYSNADYGVRTDVDRKAILKDADLTRLTASVSNGSVVVAHTLRNRTGNASTDFDASSFYITVTIAHEDKPQEERTIYIVQHPAISITAKWTDATFQGAGVFVNGYQGDNNATNGMGIGWSGTDTDRNKNFNHIKVTINKLNPESDYQIADPRMDQYSETDLSELGPWSGSWTQAPDMGTPPTTRGLQYYRNVKEGEMYKNLIAPSFIIASSHAGTSRSTWEGAVRRCASYQEDGYPAGRWRVPTYAEMEFLLGLSQAGKIERVLGGIDGDSYFVNAGIWVMHFSGGSVTGTEFVPRSSGAQSYVRCVYDTWYWKDKCDKNTFTWGDKQ